MAHWHPYKIPLHVCCGIADFAAGLVFDGDVLGKRSDALLWR